ADRNEKAPERNVIGHARMAHSAEEDRVKWFELRDTVFRHHAAGFDVALAAPVEMAPVECKTEALAGGFEHADALGDDFLANPIAGNHRDHVSFHRAGWLASCALSRAEMLLSGCDVFAPRSNSASAAPTSVIAPRNANPAKKFPVRLFR